jgi:hypothetical protein
VNADPLALPSCGKYEVSKALAAGEGVPLPISGSKFPNLAA